MKRTILILLFVVIAMFYIGCSNDNFNTPTSSQSDNLERVLAKVKTSFTGTSNPVAAINPGSCMPLPNGKTLCEGEIAEWYDNTSDARVTGKSIWYINKKINTDGSGNLWGKAELFVEGNNGKWEMTWQGRMTPEGIIAEAIGTGKEGAVKGLVAKWTYTMIFANGIFYTSEGYIN